LDVVGLTGELLGPRTPNLSRLAAEGGSRTLGTVTPAGTGSVQSAFTTGSLPREHGCVAKGWICRAVARHWPCRASQYMTLDATGRKRPRRVFPRCKFL